MPVSSVKSLMPLSLCSPVSRIASHSEGLIELVDVHHGDIRPYLVPAILISLSLVPILKGLRFDEGVDVPGDALELLLITKLPFDVPTEPLIAAKLEMIKRTGGNPFLDFSVPEAIIKFRQGFGRLIRHKNDIGAVLICDNRLSRMQYGHQFLNSLPVNGKIIKDSDALFAELADWFDKKSMTAGKMYEG